MSTEVRDTTVYPQNRDGFVATQHALIYKMRGEYPTIRRIYEVEDATVDWDLPELRASLKDGEKVYAMGSHFGFYCYIILKQSGRKETLSPFGNLGMHYRVTCNIQEEECDVETFGAHVVKNYWR